MFRVLVLVLAISTISARENYTKCCPSDSVLIEANPSFNCSKSPDVRLLVISNSTDFVGKGAEGRCVDIFGEALVRFRFNGSDLVLEEVVDEEPFSKCCPLDYFYNSTTHGCVKGQGEWNEFYNEEFLKIGLRECKIIVDVRLRGSDVDEFTRGRRKNGHYCVDRDEKKRLIVRVCKEDFNICRKVKCVHKCCPDGQSFVNGSNCVDTFVHGVDLWSLRENLENPNESFAIVHGSDLGPVYPFNQAQFEFSLDRLGVFTIKELDETLGKRNVTKHYQIEEEEYCIEHAVKQQFNRYSFFRVFSNKQIYIKFMYTRIAMGISCIFLLFTILYYCFSKEKRTVFGKTLISFCFVFFVVFLILTYLAFDMRPDSEDVCVGLAFLLLYTTLSCFTWMNIMCIDIYCTFGSSSFSTPQNRGRELTRFLLYSLYGWGVPLILTLIPLLLYEFDVEMSPFDVIINTRKCFLHKGDGNYAQLLFSTSYLTVLQLCNLVLFVKTSMYCLKVKREITKMNDSHSLKGEKRKKLNKFHDRFGLLIKLFLIMGVSFLFEVVSTFYDFKRNDSTAIIEIVWDTVNSLQGLFIFVIFILKKRIFRKLKSQLGFPKIRKFSLVSSAMTQTTSFPNNSS